MAGGRGTIRIMRIFLYIIIFAVFVGLYSVFGNVQVDGVEYFAPQSYIIPLLSVLMFSVLVIGLLTWRIHSLAKLDESLQMKGNARTSTSTSKKR